MKLCYDPWQDLWYQKDGQDRLSFGADKCSLPINQGNALFSFDLHVKNKNAGPLIGVMASLSKKGAVTGNGPLFKALQLEVVKQGGMTIVFTPEGIEDDRVSGFIYIPEKGSWFPVVTPLPHVVYNRVPLRKTEESTAFIHASSLFKEWNIPFFNPSFIDKYELSKLLGGDPFLRLLMPETILVSEKPGLELFLKEHGRIYIKPSLSSRGKGLFTLRNRNDGSIEYRSHSQQTVYPTFDDFWETKVSTLLNHRYIAQVEVTPANLDGNRFDFRIHAHDGPKGYRVTGVGIRCSQKQNLTTHIPNGGIMVPYERVRTEEHDQFFSALATTIGNLLSKEMGYFGEFSIDAGITSTGDYVLYEVNSKPMAFDEAEIENKRIRKIVELLFRKAGFHEHGS